MRQTFCSYSSRHLLHIQRKSAADASGTLILFLHANPACSARQTFASHPTNGTCQACPGADATRLALLVRPTLKNLCDASACDGVRRSRTGAFDSRRVDSGLGKSAVCFPACGDSIPSPAYRRHSTAGRDRPQHLFRLRFSRLNSAQKVPSGVAIYRRKRTILNSTMAACGFLGLPFGHIR